MTLANSPISLKPMESPTSLKDCLSFGRLYDGILNLMSYGGRFGCVPHHILSILNIRNNWELFISIDSFSTKRLSCVIT